MSVQLEANLPCEARGSSPTGGSTTPFTTKTAKNLNHYILCSERVDYLFQPALSTI